MLKKTKLNLLALALTAALLASGCIGGEVQDDEICITQADLSFPAAPLVGITGEAKQSFDADLSDQLKKLAVGGASTDGSFVGVTRVILTAKTGVTNFDFIAALSADVTSKVDASIPKAKLIDYTRGSSSAPSPLEIPAASDSGNLFNVLNKGAVTVNFDITTSAPTVSWTADVTVCFMVDLKVYKSL